MRGLIQTRLLETGTPRTALFLSCYGRVFSSVNDGKRKVSYRERLRSGIVDI
ncbi:unnamed protein product, partial [Arabidopsis halleri]